MASFCADAVHELRAAGGGSAVASRPAPLPERALEPLRALAARCKYLEGRQREALRQVATAAAPALRRRGANLGHSTPATALAAVAAKAGAADGGVLDDAIDGADAVAAANGAADGAADGTADGTADGAAADGAASAAARATVLDAARTTATAEAGGVTGEGAVTTRGGPRIRGHKSAAQLVALQARRAQVQAAIAASQAQAQTARSKRSRR
jgi:hypothetical protein